MGLLALLFASWKKPRTPETASAAEHAAVAEVVERRLNWPDK